MNIDIAGLTQGGQIWVPFVAAVIGGLFSLVGSVAATSQANRNARRVRHEEEERRGAERAYGTFFKLMDGYNSVANLKRHIDEMFNQADEHGDHEMEPWAKVMIIVGASEVIHEIQPHETFFLIEEKKADLLNDVHLIQKRISHIIASSQRYNELRSALHEFLEANLTTAHPAEGTRMAAEFEGRSGVQARFREAQLNNFLGQIIESIEKDVPESWRIVEAFSEAAKSRYGDKFPEFKVENVAG